MDSLLQVSPDTFTHHESDRKNCGRQRMHKNDCKSRETLNRRIFQNFKVAGTGNTYCIL